MADKQITDGNVLSNNSGGVTISNAIDPSTNAPSTLSGAVSYSLDVAGGLGVGGTTVPSGRNYVGIDMRGGDDTLIAENMVWANTSESSSRNSFDSIDMGAGNDYVSLDRSAVRNNLEMGAGNDTLIMTSTYARNTNLGDGNDLLVIGPGESGITEAEASAKASASVMNMNGGSGSDTLNLIGDWTITLSSGAATVNGVTVNTLSSDQMTSGVVSLPAVLGGTVSWGTMQVGSSVVTSQATFQNFNAINAVCFTAGTLIETPDGRVAIETLKVGDAVVTASGVKPITWIGKRRLDIIDLAANPKMMPILIPAGAFGGGLPTADVRVSPQHRFVVRSAIAQRMFGAQEVLVAAKHLVGQNGIEVDTTSREVVYIHMMFDEHTCVDVYGISAETMYPGAEAFKMVSKDALEELRQIFGDQIDAIIEGALVKDSCLPMLKGRDARALAARHAKNDKPLYC